MAKENKVDQSHIISVFYQKLWEITENSSQVFVYDKRYDKDKEARKTGIGNVTAKRKHYIDRSESYLSDTVEYLAAPSLRKLKAEDLSALTVE